MELKNSLNRAQIKLNVKNNHKMEYKCKGRQERETREGSCAKRYYTTLEGKII